MPIAPVSELITELKAGRMIVLVDEEDRENEGDLVLAADYVTPDKINFMAKYGRGLICLTLTQKRCLQLGLPLMVAQNSSVHGTAFTVSIEAAEGVSTGISAADRSRTIERAVAKNAEPSDLVQPGHIFPLMAQSGGVLVRAGHTEAGCDLCEMAELTPAAVICEILKEDGSMARLPDLEIFAEHHGLKIGTIADLIHHRSRTETLIARLGQKSVRTTAGYFDLITYRDTLNDGTYLALCKGLAGQHMPVGCEVLVRVHEPVSLLDFLDLDSASHAWSIPAALSRLAEAEQAVLILFPGQEEAEQLRQRALHEALPANSSKELRHYGLGAQILRDLGVTKMRLLAKPRKMPSMAGFGLEVAGLE